MKRVLSILLATLLVFSAMSIIAVSATGDPTFTVGSATIAAGDTTVSVPVTIENGVEISYYKLTVQYSATDLSLKSITDEKAGGDVTINNAKGVMSVVFADATALNGKVATLNFDVLEGAQTSEVTVTYQATVLDLNTFEASPVEFTVVPGTITVPAAGPTAQEQFEAAIAKSVTPDAADPFKTASAFNGLEMIGVQQKADNKGGVRFITAAAAEVLNDANVTDYGYIFAKTSKTPDAVANTIDKLTCTTVAAANKVSCKGSASAIAKDYGDTASATTYKYVTCGVDNIPAGKTVVARFFVETSYGTTYYYATYGNLAGIAYRA